MPLNTPNLAGDVSGGVYATSVDKLKGNSVAGTAPASGQVLTWDGSQWAPATPNTGGGGGANGLTYYLNQNTAADSPVTGIPGTPKQLGRVGETGQTSVTTGTLTQNTWTRVAGFVSESAPQDPATILIPAGLWDLNVWALGTANQNAPSSIRVLIYVYDGTATTLIATSSATVINTASTQYSVSALVPQTTIAATDRIYIELQALATGTGHTVTAQFGDGTPSHIHTSLPLVGGTGLWKNVSGALQSPATLLVDADVDAAAAIAQSKISGLTAALAGKAAQTVVEVFATPGTFTWTKPANAKTVSVMVIAGGGGGSSGRVNAGVTGGGGGAGGGFNFRGAIPASQLGATETVVVGAGGTGGAAVSSANSQGIVGQDGGSSSFGTTPWVFAAGGGGGGLIGAAGSASNRNVNAPGSGGSGGSGAAGNAGGSSAISAAGGGGGGGATASTWFNGGNGQWVLGNNGSGGQSVTNNAEGAAGSAGTSLNSQMHCGGGGSGGAGAYTKNAGVGGTGGLYGGGGGGGGCQGTQNGVLTSGAGGNGAQGIVIVTTYF